MEIRRDFYLDKLIRRKNNGLIKVITGIRRCGKSYLLFNIYKSYLKSIGVEDEQIICLALDDDENIQYRNPLELGKYIRSMTTDESKTYYVFLDEIQKVVTIQNPYIQGVEDKIGFVDVVLGLMKHDNIDVYVTGSNSKMLSSDILTEFRGRGDEIRVNPLSFEEFYHAYEGDKRDAWQEYYTYGGLLRKSAHLRLRGGRTGNARHLFGQQHRSGVRLQRGRAGRAGRAGADRAGDHLGAP